MYEGETTAILEFPVKLLASAVDPRMWHLPRIQGIDQERVWAAVREKMSIVATETAAAVDELLQAVQSNI